MKNNNHKPVEITLSEKGKNLYFFFGGICAGIGTPVFEFYNSSKIMDENLIFIRDFAQCWYQAGIPGIGKDLDSTTKYIRQQIEEIKPEKTFFAGNSMGGYAAILFACLVGQGEVIAFAPQTFISPILRIKHKDSRWKKQIYNTYRRSLFKRKAWNLKPLILRLNGSQTISIFVSNDDELDYIHASHIRNIPGVNIYEFESGGHRLIKLLRDEGKLPTIMSGTYA